MGSKNRRSKRSSARIYKSSRRHKTRENVLAEKTILSRLFRKSKKQEDVKDVFRTPICGWRLWLFRSIAVIIIPALLFLLLEVTLRIVGYGFPTSMTVPCQVNDTDSYCSNIKFSWRFFH